MPPLPHSDACHPEHSLVQEPGLRAGNGSEAVISTELVPLPVLGP